MSTDLQAMTTLIHIALYAVFTGFYKQAYRQLSFNNDAIASECVRGAKSTPGLRGTCFSLCGET